MKMSPSLESRSHITALPKGFVIVRILQLFFALTTFAFTIFRNAVYPTVGSVIGTVASGISSITLIWLLITSYHSPKAYNYWAILAFEIFLFLFWMPTFLFTLFDAFFVDDFLQPQCNREYNYSTRTSSRVCHDPTTLSKAFGVTLALTGAFAGVLLILYLVSLIVVSVFIGRHRTAGGHCSPGSAPPLSQADIEKHLEDEEALKQQNAQLQEQYRTLREENATLQNQIGVATPQPAHHAS